MSTFPCKPCFSCTVVAEYNPRFCDACVQFKHYLDAFKASMAWSAVSAAERADIIRRRDFGRGQRREP